MAQPTPSLAIHPHPRLRWQPAGRHIECASRDGHEYRIVAADYGGVKLHRIPAGGWWHRRASWCRDRVTARRLAEVWASCDHDRKLPSQSRQP